MNKEARERGLSVRMTEILAEELTENYYLNRIPEPYRERVGNIVKHYKKQGLLHV